MIAFDEACRLLDQAIMPLGTETLALALAHNRYLAETLYAQIDAPRFVVSTMDGYAISDRNAVSGKGLRIVGESRPGAGYHGKMGEGEAVRIFTGAALPLGADRVVIQENARREGDVVHLCEGDRTARFVRDRGSDFAAGTSILAAGTHLGPGAMIAAAAADRDSVVVRLSPRVAIIATGDELAAPGSAYPFPFAVPESASLGVAAMAVEAGAQIVSREIGADDLAQLVNTAGACLDNADLVVVIGGASVGDRDFAKPMFEPHGLETIFTKVAIRPGKPVWLGKARDRIVLGLPGNPSSAMVCAALFMRPILELLQGARRTDRWRTLPLASPLGPTDARETFARAKWERDGLVPLDNQDSGAQAPLVQADWLIRCPPHQEALASGAMVAAIPF